MRLIEVTVQGDKLGYEEGDTIREMLGNIGFTEVLGRRPGGKKASDVVILRGEFTDADVRQRVLPALRQLRDEAPMRRIPIPIEAITVVAYQSVATYSLDNDAEMPAATVAA